MYIMVFEVVAWFPYCGILEVEDGDRFIDTF